MAAVVTMGAAIAAMKYFDGVWKEIALRAVDRGLKQGVRLAVTEFMVGGGSGQNAEPPNPPPGPLKIRSGRARRAVGYQPARWEGQKITGGLTLDTSRAPHAAIHEFGGQTGAHVILPKKAKMLRFERDGKVIFARKVNHPGSRIPARPFLKPAMIRAEEIIRQELVKELTKLTQRLFG